MNQHCDDGALYWGAMKKPSVIYCLYWPLVDKISNTSDAPIGWHVFDVSLFQLNYPTYHCLCVRLTLSTYHITYKPMLS